MKKILLINDYITNFGGAEKVVFDIKNLLEKKGYKVYLLGDKEKNENFISFFRRYFSFKYFLKTYKFIKNNNINIVHIHSISRNISPTPIIASKFLGKKIVMTVHDFHYYCPKTWGILANGKECKTGFNNLCWLKNCKPKTGVKNIPYNFLKWLKVLIHRIIIKNYVDIFICPSKKLQEYMIKSLNLPKEKIIYLPNFIELEESYYPNFDKINDKKFLFVGRLSKEKGVEMAIKAFDILVNKQGKKDIIFEIIGDGPEKEILKSLVKKLKLEKNIKFLGRIENEKLKNYYESAVGLIMPSVWLENNPLVAIEGMKFGKPIIATNIGGYPDLIENNKNGYLFNLGNYIELSEKIKNLYKNKDFSVKMGKYGFQKLKENFGSKEFYKKLVKIYKK